MDGAGWHLSKSVKIPKGIHLCCLPSHSPELQPAERLWPLTNEPIANRYFSSLDEVPSCFIPTVSKTLRSQTINLRFDSWTVVAGTKSFINVRPWSPTRLFWPTTIGRSLGSQGRTRIVTISPLICRALTLINCRSYRCQSTGHDITCPPHHWTSIALFTAIDCTDFELGDGGVKGDRAIE